MNGTKVVDKLSICKVGSVHFWHRIHPKKKIRILQEMVQSLRSMRSKVRGFYGKLNVFEYREMSKQFKVKVSRILYFVFITRLQLGYAYLSKNVDSAKNHTENLIVPFQAVG
jgi:hypothetical protein